MECMHRGLGLHFFGLPVEFQPITDAFVTEIMKTETIICLIIEKNIHERILSLDETRNSNTKLRTYK